MTLEYFGTDGIRGPAGGGIVNPRFAARLGVAAGRWVKRLGKESALVLIGRDTRPSGNELMEGLVTGLSSENLATLSFGVAPTPALALAVPREKACLGVMITASHNPSCDNGFKFFNHLGHKLDPSDEALLENLLPKATPTGSGQCPEMKDPIGPYLEHLATALPENVLQDWVIALDTANGATAQATRIALDRLGAKVEQIGEAAKDQLINDGVGSEQPAGLARLTLEKKARLGIAHDGDGDRVVFCDENGTVVAGDCILGILALDALHRGLNGSGNLVSTVYANHGLDKSLNEHGVRVERTEVGDRCVSARMQQIEAAVGGEPSGHIILRECSPAGDGPMAALNLVRIMFDKQQSLSELKKCVTLLPSLSGAFFIEEKKPLEEMSRLQAKVGEWETRLAGRGRIFVRYSGTETKIRLLVEAPNASITRQAFEAVEDTLRKELKFA